MVPSPEALVELPLLLPPTLQRLQQAPEVLRLVRTICDQYFLFAANNILQARLGQWDR